MGSMDRSGNDDNDGVVALLAEQTCFANEINLFLSVTENL
jgi:hypothetical protein